MLSSKCQNRLTKRFVIYITHVLKFMYNLHNVAYEVWDMFKSSPDRPLCPSSCVVRKNVWHVSCGLEGVLETATSAAMHKLHSQPRSRGQHLLHHYCLSP